MNTNQTQEHEPVIDGIPLTDWQTPDVKPMAIGVYKTQYQVKDKHGDAKIEIGYSKWDGTNWGPQFDTPEAAEGSGETAVFPAPDLYRGLAAEHPEHQL